MTAESTILGFIPCISISAGVFCLLRKIYFKAEVSGRRNRLGVLSLGLISRCRLNRAYFFKDMRKMKV